MIVDARSPLRTAVSRTSPAAIRGALAVATLVTAILLSALAGDCEQIHKSAAADSMPVSVKSPSANTLAAQAPGPNRLQKATATESNFWATDFWRYGLSPFLPVAAALVAIAGAIRAAVIQANGAVRAQIEQQARISEREMARQHKIDEGVKAQLQAHLRSIESLCQSLVMKPEGIEFSFLVDDFKAFAARARESDIPTALSVAETAAIFTAGVAMRNTAVALENNLVPNAELSPLQSAWTKWHAFSAGVTCARTSAILGDIEAYVAFRTIMGDLVMDLIIDEMRNANAYPSWDKHGLLRDMDTLEADAVVIRKSSPDFQPPEIITLLPKDIPEKT